MYILYYFNQNYQIQTIEVDTLDAPILIPENLIFINLRKGINFIKEPHECIDFTHLERLIMASEFTDTEIIKDGDFRKANTFLTPLCPIEPQYLSFDFDPKIFIYEGAPVLAILETDTTNLQALFSVDGITFNYIFDYDYWYTPEGEAQDGIMYEVSNGRLIASIYLDHSFTEPPHYSNTVPQFKSVYFKNKVTGEISNTYDLSSFYV